MSRGYSYLAPLFKIKLLPTSLLKEIGHLSLEHQINRIRHDFTNYDALRNTHTVTDEEYNRFKDFVTDRIKIALVKLTHRAEQNGIYVSEGLKLFAQEYSNAKKN